MGGAGDLAQKEVELYSLIPVEPLLVLKRV